MGIYGTRDGKFKVKKLTIEDQVGMSYVIPYTATVATGTIVGGLDLNAATTAITATTFSVQPPYPLTIGVTANESETDQLGRVRVTGYDSVGTLRFEDVKIASTAASTYYTNYSYAKINTLQPYTSAGVLATTTSTDIGINYGNKAGLPNPIASSVDVISVTVASVQATTARTVTVAYNQVTLNATIDKSVHIMYKTKFQ